jgi:hypothetical protein
MSRARCTALTAVAVIGVTALLALQAATVSAQPPRPTAPARSPREAAPIDLTGQWVAIVTEDWRFRMVTAPRGDYPGVQMTPAGMAIAEAWDPAKDQAEGEECRAYGAAGIMRIPGRLRISWRDDSTLEIQTDAGRQTRLLNFGTVPEQSEPTWQGVSKAEWIVHGGGFGRPVSGGSLKVVTTGMREGYLRRNGVPYSASTVLTEYLDVLNEPDGSQWLIVKSIVEDPLYHTSPPITSTSFRKQTDRSGWDPTPCSAR